MINRALEGVKVSALIQGITGPLTAAILASYGAKVLRIESRNRIEWHRQAGPFIGNISSPDRAIGYLIMNPGMYGITLNLKHPRAREVITRIIEWSDIIVENFAGGVMERMGLGYQDLNKINPQIIMLSAAIYGHTGPFAEVRGYGGTLTALTGISQITGFPNQAPIFPGFAVTDYIAPRANVMAIVAALDYRRRTGKGQYIDAAQLETVIPLLTPLLLEYETNGKEPTRLGNRSTYAAPHGVYRCKGDERWCAITVFTDGEWESFCQAIGNPPWSQELKYSSRMRRLDNVDQLDRLVEEWTINHSAEEVMGLMQDAGIAAGVVQGGQDMSNDPQLEYRYFYSQFDHPEIGNFIYGGMPAKLSKTNYELRRAPMLGEHNEYVYTQLLGIPDEEFSQLMADGVFE